jgi:signal transduction histidine kinase
VPPSCIATSTRSVPSNPLQSSSTIVATAMTVHWSLRPAIMLTPPYFGFQLLAFFAFEAFARLGRAHAELRAVHEILADSSRIAERLRISRELHDALGHHLTALSLNIEVALHKTSGAAVDHLNTAQSLTRKVLGDVRDIAASIRNSGDVDLAQALQPLVSDVPRPRIHLEIEPGIRIDDPEQAHVIVRCTQEIVTNAARHSSAENLWIAISRDAAGVRIHARDDGRGAIATAAGFGLRSMRDRVEGAGGELRVASQPGSGFEVTALLPRRSPA